MSDQSSIYKVEMKVERPLEELSHMIKSNILFLMSMISGCSKVNILAAQPLLSAPHRPRADIGVCRVFDFWKCEEVKTSARGLLGTDLDRSLQTSSKATHIHRYVSTPPKQPTYTDVSSFQDAWRSKFIHHRRLRATAGPRQCRLRLRCHPRRPSVRPNLRPRPRRSGSLHHTEMAYTQMKLVASRIIEIFKLQVVAEMKNPPDHVLSLTMRMKDGLRQFADVKKQTVFFLQTADVWSTSSSAEVCRYGPQTADVLPLKKQTEPKTQREGKYRKWKQRFNFNGYMAKIVRVLPISS
ncbi:hypothetical protein LXL04_010477 [Taraxacum kok-saghyz]